MTHLARRVAMVTAAFMLTLASLAPGDLALGLALGTGLALALRTRTASEPEHPETAWRLRPGPLLRFAVAVLADVVAGTWDVSLRVLHLRAVSRPGIVAVPVGARSARGVAVTALALTLSPGTVLIDIDRSRRLMLIHFIDASDPDALRARLDRFYERYQRPVFP